MTPLNEFRDLLRESIGLDSGSIGLSAIARAVQERQSAFAAGDRKAYWQHLRECDAELQALIDAVVVPETWFFRDREAFDTMARLAHEHVVRAPATDVFRLLSVPCSTGEEPYSMAMALLDAGVSADRFSIDAADVSARALARAGDATYGKNSFRGQDLAFRDRHFEDVGGSYRLNDAVRRQVRFQHGNILADEFLKGEEPYDAIFCRNLLIYFDRTTQERAIVVMRRWLKTGGTLFVAPSETGVLLNHLFEPAKVPLAFAFRKVDARVRTPKAPAPRAARSATVVASRVAPAKPAPPKRSPPAAAPAPDASLQEAVRLADQGRFAEATVCCDEHMRLNGPSAGVFHLKGLLCDSAGDPVAASSFYRKALYLEPAHHETLIHLALVLAQQGDHAGAMVLRNRARRHERGGGAHRGTER